MTALRGLHLSGVCLSKHGRSLCRFRPQHPDQHRGCSIENAAIESCFLSGAIGQKLARLGGVEFGFGGFAHLLDRKLFCPEKREAGDQLGSQLVIEVYPLATDLAVSCRQLPPQAVVGARLNLTTCAR